MWGSMVVVVSGRMARPPYAYFLTRDAEMAAREAYRGTVELPGYILATGVAALSKPTVLPVRPRGAACTKAVSKSVVKTWVV